MTYFLIRRGGHGACLCEIECSTDEAALQRAEQVSDLLEEDVVPGFIETRVFGR